MEEIDIKGKILQIENPRGNIIAMITISEQGYIIGGVNCEVADIEDTKIRIQQIDNIL